MLEIEGLTAGPEGRCVLRDLDLSVARGGRTALLGPSGAGKTTLLRAVAGLLEPDAGTVSVDGAVVHDGSRSVEPAQRGISLVFQSFALWPHLTASEHLRLVVPGASEAAGRDAQDAELDWLGRLGLGELRDRLPGQLSGGEQARLSLARALAARPRVLLMDEPFRNLDPALARELRNELVQWFDETSLTVLLVTHDPQEAEQLTDRWCFLHHGSVAAHDVPEKLRARPGYVEVAQLFGRADALPGRRLDDGRMETAIGTVVVEGADEADHVVLRPEDLDITRGGDDGVIERQYFEAGRSLLQIRVGESRVHGLARDGLSAGDSVALTVDHPLCAVRRLAQDREELR